MEFKTTEKNAIAKVLTTIADADTVRQLKERMFLNQIAKMLNMSSAEVRLAANIKFESALNTIKEMSVAKKKVVKILVDEMVMADDTSHPYERQYVFAINNALN